MEAQRCSFRNCLRLRWGCSEMCHTHSGAQKQWIDNILSSCSTSAESSSTGQTIQKGKKKKKHPSAAPEIDTISNASYPSTSSKDVFPQPPLPQSNTLFVRSSGIDPGVGLGVPVQQSHFFTALYHQQNTNNLPRPPLCYYPNLSTYIASGMLAHQAIPLAMSPNLAMSAQALGMGHERTADGDHSVFRLTPGHKMGNTSSDTNEPKNSHSSDSPEPRSWHSPNIKSKTLTAPAEPVLQDLTVQQQIQSGSVIQDSSIEHSSSDYDQNSSSLQQKGTGPVLDSFRHQSSSPSQHHVESHQNDGCPIDLSAQQQGHASAQECAVHQLPLIQDQDPENAKAPCRERSEADDNDDVIITGADEDVLFVKAEPSSHTINAKRREGQQTGNISKTVHSSASEQLTEISDSDDDDCIVLDLSVDHSLETENDRQTDAHIEIGVKCHPIAEQNGQDIREGSQQIVNESVLSAGQDTEALASSEEASEIKVLETVSLSEQPPTHLHQDAVAKTYRQLSTESYYRCGCSKGRCGFRTVLPTQFELHLLEGHQYDVIYPCVHCGSQEVGIDSLMGHLEKHLTQEGVTLLCSTVTCQHMFRSPEELLNHIQVRHPEHENHICWLCNTMFKNVATFCSHIKQNLLCVVKCPYCSAKHVKQQAILTHMASSHPDQDGTVTIQKILVCQERKSSYWNTADYNRDQSHSEQTKNGQDVMTAGTDNILTTRNHPIDVQVSIISPTVSSKTPPPPAKDDKATPPRQLSPSVNPLIRESTYDEDGLRKGKVNINRNDVVDIVSSKTQTPPTKDNKPTLPRQPSPSVNALIRESLCDTDGLQNEKVNINRSDVVDIVSSKTQSPPTNDDKPTPPRQSSPSVNALTRESLCDADGRQNEKVNINRDDVVDSSDECKAKESRGQLSDGCESTTASAASPKAKAKDVKSVRGKQVLSDGHTELSDCSQDFIREVSGSADISVDVVDEKGNGNPDRKVKEKEHAEHIHTSSEASDEEGDGGMDSEAETTSWIDHTCRYQKGETIRCSFCDHESQSVDEHIRHIHVEHKTYFKGFSCQRCGFVSIDQDAKTEHRCGGSRRLRSRSRISYSENEGTVSTPAVSKSTDADSEYHVSTRSKRNIPESPSVCPTPSVSEPTRAEVECEPRTRCKRKQLETSQFSPVKTAKLSVENGLTQNLIRNSQGVELSCELCGVRGTSRSGMQLHIYSQHADVMVCPICSEKVDSDRQLHLHLLDLHPDQSAIFDKVKSKNFISLLHSMDAGEEGVLREKLSVDENEDGSGSSSGGAGYKEMVTESTRKADQLSASTGTADAASDKDDEAEPISGATENHRAVAASHQHEAKTGNEQISRDAHLPSSLNKGFKYELLACNLCDYFSHCQMQLRNHLYSEHSEVMKCPKCEVHPTSDCNFYSHLNEMHKEDKDSIYAQHRSFRWMSVVYPAEAAGKQLNCKLCDFSSSELAVLQDHMYSEHKDEMKCPRCHLELTSDQELLRHLTEKHADDRNLLYSQHRSISWLVTPKGSSQRTPMSSVKDFQCQHCSYSARFISTVMNHMFMTHMKRKCLTCNMTVKTFKALREHINKQHPEQKEALVHKVKRNKAVSLSEASQQKAGVKSRKWVASHTVGKPMLLRIRKQSPQKTSPTERQQSTAEPSVHSGNTSSSTALNVDHPAQPSDLTKPSCKMAQKTTAASSGNSAEISSRVPLMATEQYNELAALEVNESMEYRCPHCTSDFKWRYRFYEHLCYHYHYRCFKCAHCTFLAFSGSSIVNHSRRTHCEEPVVHHLPKQTFENRIERVMNQSYIRATEPYTERRVQAYERARLRKEMKRHGKGEKLQKNCEMSVKQTKLKTKKTKELLPCKEIIKLKSPKKLKALKKVTSGSDPISDGMQLMCPYCRGQKMQRLRVENEIRYHIHYKPYSCPYCKFTSGSEKCVQRHIGFTHPKEEIVVNYKRIESKEERFQILFNRAVKLSKSAVKTEVTSCVRKKYMKKIEKGLTARPERMKRQVKKRKRTANLQSAPAGVQPQVASTGDSVQSLPTDVGLQSASAPAGVHLPSEPTRVCLQASPTVEVQCAHCPFTSTERAVVTSHIFSSHQDLLAEDASALQPPAALAGDSLSTENISGQASVITGNAAQPLSGKSADDEPIRSGSHSDKISESALLSTLNQSGDRLSTENLPVSGKQTNQKRLTRLSKKNIC